MRKVGTEREERKTEKGLQKKRYRKVNRRKERHVHNIDIKKAEERDRQRKRKER
jgi:hypothetical protein